MGDTNGLPNLQLQYPDKEPQLITIQTLAKNSVPAGVTLKTVNSTKQKNSKPSTKNSLNSSTEVSNSPVSPSKNFISSSLDHQDLDTDSTSKKRFRSVRKSKKKKVDKCGKGLRHFAMKVCEKMKEKGTTTYNAVADDLMNEITNPAVPPIIGQQYDRKNIRRRVYDVLNVLTAMNIISRDNREVKWIGMPTSSLQECLSLVSEKKERVDRVKQKTEELQEIIWQQICFKRLVDRNVRNEQTCGQPVLEDCAVQLPFLLLKTSKDTVINISVSQDRQEYHFMFDDNFEIQDDVDILKEMGLLMGLDKGLCTKEDLETAKSFVPEVLKQYVEPNPE